MTKEYRVLLYYKYTPIAEAEIFAENHLKFCKDTCLKGRVLVAEEGINGTVSGTFAQTQAYIDHMNADPRFADVTFKIDEADGHTFKKMFVRYRPEIVSLHLAKDDLDPNEVTGEYLSPEAFREAVLDENTVVIDARNDYEYDLGHFRGAVRPEIRNFRELPQWISANKEQFMDKRVVTYCTGGVRCEKFSGWLVKEGFKDVGQLHGGIATYGKDEKVKGDLWDGKMYVFDERISVDINRVEHVIVGKDWFDGTPCERYINCANPSCNRQMLCSEENEHKYLRSCSPECRVHEPNYYVQKYNLTRSEVEARLAALGESFDVSNAAAKNN